LLFTSDLSVSATQEMFGDMEGRNHPTIIPGEGTTHFVYLFAQWGSIEFTIEFYGNKLTGSTTPYFNTGDGFNSDVCDEKIYVEFDTDNYYSKDESGNKLADNAINNIIVDRYGYTWTGWYFIYQNYELIESLDVYSNIELKLKEDPIRILRAIRFMGKLNFELDKELEHSIIKLGYLLNELTISQTKKELEKMNQKSIDKLKELNLNQYLKEG